MQRFTDIRVWQRSHALTLAVYRQSRDFPAEERYGLTAQIRRAAGSVPTNIAEGSKRKRRFDYARFLNVAEGSLAELEYQLMLARDLGYMARETSETLQEEVREVASMLHRLRETVEETERRERKERRTRKREVPERTPNSAGDDAERKVQL